MQQRPAETAQGKFDASLYDRFAATIFTYLLSQVQNEQDAQDLLLEVFLAALGNELLSSLPEESQLAWLRRVARNKVVDRYRHITLLTFLPRPQAVFKHWNGSQWAIYPDPASEAQTISLHAIAAASANDVWAVGNYDDGPSHTLVMHWNGTQWSIVESPGLGNRYISVSDVAALSANDVWEVGYEIDNNGPLIEHWDGKQWTVVKSPDSGTVNALYGMDSVPHSNTIIVVGTTYYSTGETGTVLYITSLSG